MRRGWITGGESSFYDLPSVPQIPHLRLYFWYQIVSWYFLGYYPKLLVRNVSFNQEQMFCFTTTNSQIRQSYEYLYLDTARNAGNLFDTQNYIPTLDKFDRPKMWRRHDRHK